MDRVRWNKLFVGTDRLLLKDFKKYHESNPELYELFKRYTKQAHQAGRKRFSIWMIANRIRWYSAVETTGPEFKVSNDYLALYARKLIYDHPEYEGFFTIKRMKPKRVRARE